MPRFRSKIVEIEAVNWNGEGLALGEIPEWLRTALMAEAVKRDGETLKINTLEGVMTVSPGDWIIRGTEGELYPCKPSVFERKYEPADPVIGGRENLPTQLFDVALQT
jgi:hypothetical protein